ncbi:hypothetical protein DM01DRAFT_1391777 [Hesseltinella vesiculosa]|uniref:GST N-terminal domain-containing protein n=1 Tax=Hesseltinella vesiculosa TaxID=101127 RepID=A0A1X2GFG6_9FUNG|nr:hypothetical protein DM01DRAFT_1391777 [Hesseltinella vesiculosa]
MSPPIVFYDLELDTPNEIWSPNTARTRVCLNIKKIPFETRWLTFFDVQTVIPELTQNGVAPTVPVIVDKAHGDKVVQESWEIARYLDEAFPEAPKLIGDHEPLFFFFNRFVFNDLMMNIHSLVVLKVHNKCTPKELQDWFRKGREEIYKRKLEDFTKDEDSIIKEIKHIMRFINMTLRKYPFLAGDRPTFADATVAGAFIFLKALRPELFGPVLLDAIPRSDAVRKWWDRMLPYTDLDSAPSSNL